jgi:hypothetical protein
VTSHAHKTRKRYHRIEEQVVLPPGERLDPEVHVFICGRERVGASVIMNHMLLVGSMLDEDKN